MEVKERIAICFYGQPRLIKKGYENISKFINKCSEMFEVDIFVHTWFSKNMIGKSYLHSSWRNITEDEIRINKDDIDTVINLYSPKSIEVDEPRLFTEEINKITNLYIYNNSNSSIKNNITNFLSNLYSKYRVSKLLFEYCSQNYCTYNKIISMRFDFLKTIPFDFNKSINDKIYTFPTNGRFYLCDHLIIFTNTNYYYNYSNTFNNIESINKSEECKQLCNNFNLQFILNMEEILTFNLGLYYKEEYIKLMVIFSNDIVNFI